MTEKAKANVAEMTAAELAAHIKSVDLRHRQIMTALRALHRVRVTEEEGTDDGEQ